MFSGIIKINFSAIKGSNNFFTATAKLAYKAFFKVCDGWPRPIAAQALLDSGVADGENDTALGYVAALVETERTHDQTLPA